MVGRVRHFVAPKMALQAPLSMGLSGKNTEVGFHALLQGIFPIQGLNLGLLHNRQILYHLSHWGSPNPLGSPKLGKMNLYLDI